MDNLIGKKLDGLYELQELVGTGGMANVYRGVDLRSGQAVAVKVLREEYAHDQELVRRFKNESKAISILNCPNIVKVYDVSVSEKLQYIVMEYIEGITLKEYLVQRGGKITWRETIHFVGQILTALQHAHENGVVHRDVKPQNIMLLPNGQVKMMDFGIARISRAENQLLTGKTMGSVHYISPEQAKGEVTDAKSDIYSVGIMMYEMLSGRLPFESGTVVEVAIKQISDTPTPLAELVPEVPKGLVEITEHAMAKRPEERYASAAAMIEDINKFKKNPDIIFQYKYVQETAPAKVISKAMKQTKTGATQSAAKPKKTKKKRGFPFLPILCGITVAFAIGCGVLCNLILENSNNPLFSTKVDVVLKDYTGMTRDEVKADEGYKTVKVEWVEEYSGNYAEGVVYKQSPAGGRTVRQNQTVKLTVSLGTKYVTLEDYTNMAQDDAKQLLTDAGLNVVMQQSVDASVAVGAVIRTDPAAGTTVEAGTVVYLYVSRTQVATTTKVPACVGLTLEDARALLGSSKLTVGAITEEYNDSYAQGIVINQTVEPDSEIKINGRVGLTVSLGVYVPPTTTVPNVIGWESGAASGALSDASLSVSVAQEYNATVPTGNVIWQSIDGGAVVEQGTGVTITVSMGPAPTPVPTAVPATPEPTQEPAPSAPVVADPPSADPPADPNAPVA